MSSSETADLKSMELESQDTSTPAPAPAPAKQDSAADTPSLKRPPPEDLPSAALDDASTPSKKSKASENENAQSQREIIDVAVRLGFKAGDRIEVEYDVCPDSRREETSHTHWWGATLIEYEGDVTEEGVAVRTLDYDAYPEGGFPERCQEKVIFVNSGILVQADGEDATETLNYRIEGGQDETTVLLTKEDFRNHLNDMLMKIMDTQGDKFKKLPAAQQAHVAEMICKGKERLIETIDEKWRSTNSVIRAEDVPSIFEEAFGKMRP